VWILWPALECITTKVSKSLSCEISSNDPRTQRYRGREAMIRYEARDQKDQEYLLIFSFVRTASLHFSIVQEKVVKASTWSPSGTYMRDRTVRPTPHPQSTQTGIIPSDLGNRFQSRTLIVSRVGGPVMPRSNRYFKLGKLLILRPVGLPPALTGFFSSCEGGVEGIVSSLSTR